MYNGLIIIGCCFYAFKARSIPDNFNESKFIGVSVYSTVIICLSALPMYNLAVRVEQIVGALCVSLLANTYVTLLCLYLPKLYAIRFTEKTVEPFGTQNITMGKIQIPSTLGNIKKEEWKEQTVQAAETEEEEGQVDKTLPLHGANP